MFKNCSVFAILETDDKSVKVCRIEMDQDTQDSICNTFSDAVSDMKDGKELIPFDGNYKPDEDQYLTIENFDLPPEIKEAIKNPMNVSAYRPERKVFPRIKAIFIGERKKSASQLKYHVAFQRFKNDQYISNHRLNLLFDKDSFFQEKRAGISISSYIDCYYDGSLHFVSFFYTRQIFDLGQYYREATEGEIGDFSAEKILDIENLENFQKQASDSWVRRRIAIINDLKILESHTASEIKAIGKMAGIDIKIDKKKIVIPSEKKEMKKVIGFLVEEVYPGYFSKGTTYMANSKRKI